MGVLEDQKSMDVHRLRFIECDPQPINCLAFSGAADCPKLAVSRGDASIEIWATIDGEDYYKENFLPGRTDTSVEAMVWCGKRLFSAGLTGILILHWQGIEELIPIKSREGLVYSLWELGYIIHGLVQ